MLLPSGQDIFRLWKDQSVHSSCNLKYSGGCLVIKPRLFLLQPEEEVLQVGLGGREVGASQGGGGGRAVVILSGCHCPNQCHSSWPIEHIRSATNSLHLWSCYGAGMALAKQRRNIFWSTYTKAHYTPFRGPIVWIWHSSVAYFRL